MNIEFLFKRVFWSREIFAETKCDDGQTIQRIKKIFLHNLF